LVVWLVNLAFGCFTGTKEAPLRKPLYKLFAGTEYPRRDLRQLH